MIRRFSPAKINLLLRVGSRLPSGYHQLETVMIPLSLGDGLAVCHKPDGVSLEIVERYDFSGNTDSVSKIPTDERNLIVRIARGFLEHCGISTGVHFQLQKSIPAGGGLGGASSNAAATLLLLNELFELNWTWEQLAQFSANYGSDIAFFTQPHAAVCSGRGEIVAPFDCPNRIWFVIVRPPFGLSTPAVFAELAKARTGGQQPGHDTDFAAEFSQLIEALNCGITSDVFGSSSNDLQKPALKIRPELDRVRRCCEASHPLTQSMTGSGSSWYAGFRHRRQAVWASNRFKGRLAMRVDVANSTATRCSNKGQQ